MKLEDLIKSTLYVGREVEVEDMLQILSNEDTSYKFYSDVECSGGQAQSIYFVDGKIKHLLYSNTPLQPRVLISQVVVGAVSWKDGEGLEIIEDSVKNEFVMVVPSFMEFEEDAIYIDGLGKLKALKTDNPDLISSSIKYMATLEMELSRELALKGKGIVVKDGSFTPIFIAKESPTFIENKGPIGLVKIIYNFPTDVSEKLFSMKIGDLSPLYIKSYSDENDIVSAFLKIGKNSILRMDAIIQSKNKDIIKKAGKVFCSLASVIPQLTIDINYMRLPEDIPPIQSLEYYLGSYIITPQMASYFLHEFISQILS